MRTLLETPQLELYKKHLAVFQEYLRGKDYLFSHENHEHHELSGNSHIFSFENRIIGRTLRFRITFHERDKTAFAQVRIINADGSGFSISDWATFKSWRRLNLNFLWTENSEEFSTFVESVFSKLKDLFEHELKDIVEGRHWESIPFDWMGYK